MRDWERSEIDKPKGEKSATYDMLIKNLEAGIPLHPIDLCFSLNSGIFQVPDGLTRLAAHRDRRAYHIKARVFVDHNNRQFFLYY